jgi:hypothetical protein
LRRAARAAWDENPEGKGGVRMKAARIVFVLAAVVLVATPALAETRRTRLQGLQESPAVITGASGDFKMTIPKDDQSFTFELNYEGIEGTTVTQAHIHVGQRDINGGIVIYLCTNLSPPGGVPAPPPCPASAGTVTGTRTAADVVVQTAQGITAGDLADVLFAIRRGRAYVNVHSDTSPTGEIRGQLK